MLGYLGSWRADESAPASGALRRVRTLAGDAVDGLPLDAPEIGSAEQFTQLSVPAADLVANGRIVKFLVDLRRPAEPAVYFVNGNFQLDGRLPDEAKYHYFFARAVLDIPESLQEFNQVTYFGATKRYAAGSVHTYFLDAAELPVYGLQFYPQDVVAEDGIVAVVRAVRERLTIAGARVAFVQTGSQQTTATVTDELRAARIDILTIDDVLGSIRYLPLNVGEAWGYLRIFPGPTVRLAATDIPVFEELPLDLSVVAGVITRAVQDSSSHVNLKSKERGTPNMVLRDAAADHPRLAPWRDQPVHLTVRLEDFVIEATTAEEIARRLAARLDQPLVPLTVEDETRVLSFDEMAGGTATDALRCSSRFGSKAANLGFLSHPSAVGRVDQPGSASQRAGYDIVPAGFGVPLAFYRHLVDHGPNSELRAALAALIDGQADGTLTAEELACRAAEVQQLFLDAVIPSDDLAAIERALATVLPRLGKVKVRSSANAEDIPSFDGAGLHDSFSATVSKTSKKPGCEFAGYGDDDGAAGVVKRKVKPTTVACAVKGVYASLWNLRAIEERAYARIDQSTAAMGLAVVGAYDNESEVSANAVIVTRVLNTDGVFGYSLSIQAGNNLVTNPDPGTHSEVVIAALGIDGEPTSLTVTRYAKPTADGPQRTEPVLPEAQTRALVDLAAGIERAYCAANRAYYPGRGCATVAVDADKPRSLDIELKILANGQLVCKQVREFGGR